MQPFKTMTPFKLIVTDMDGTLLDGDHRLPRHFKAIVTGLAERGIHWAIASGRQLANLRAQFDALGIHLDILAENGALVQLGEEAEPFFVDVTPVDFFEAVLLKGLAVAGTTPVLCGAKQAWVHDGLPEHLPEVRRYFESIAPWHDLDEVRGEEICKVALYHPQAATALYPAVAPLERDDCRVILSSPCWIDVQPTRVHKGRGLEALLARRGVLPEETVVFGDYLNDLEMMQMGTHSVAMANAHPKLLEACAHQTLANTENGVLHYLRTCGVLHN